jgi:hypothetical protein
MKNSFIYFFLFTSSFVFSQDNSTYTTIESKEKSIESPVFYQFDINVPIKINTERGTTYSDGTKSSDSWFLPDGIGSKFGIGLQKNKWIAISANTGFDWKWTEKLFIVPVYGNLRLSPGIGNDNRIVLQAGIGKGVAIGRGSLSCDYMKLSLGLENDEDFNFFIEVSGYDLKFNTINGIGMISLGLSMRSF